MTVQLSFVNEDSFGSKAIRWFTHSDYSHVDIILPDGRRLGARSDHPVYGHTGVQIRNLDYAPFKRDDRLIIPTGEWQDKAGYDWLQAQIGKPYDKSGLYRSFVLSDYHWRTDDKWWCSELAAVFLEKLGIVKFRTPANRITPNDVYLVAGTIASNL